MATLTQNTVSVEDAFQLVIERVKLQQATMLWGDVGIGKSDLIRQVAAHLKANYWPGTANTPHPCYRVFIGSIKQPVDLMGLPVPDFESKTTVWLRPDDLPRVDRDGEYGILFLDEINTSAPSMQAAMFQLVLERRIGDHHLPDGWVIVAAGNRVTDRAAAQRMPSALRNRFGHFTLVPTVEGWEKWAKDRDIDQWYIAFLKFRKELLHQSPKTDDVNAFPTPRSHAAASKYINHPAALRQRLVAADIGEGAAGELETFLRLNKEGNCPSLAEILADPEKARVPDQPGGKYAVAVLLSRSIDRDNLGTLLKYAKRLGREYETLTVVDTIKRQPDIRHTEEFVQWAVANQDIRITS